MSGVTTDLTPATETDPGPYKESPWKQLPGERTAFGDEVRRVLGPPNRSTRAIPYLALFLVGYIAVSIWCQLYVSRHGTNDVIQRIDRLEVTIRGLKAAIQEDAVRIEANRKIAEATDAQVEKNRKANDAAVREQAGKTTLQRMQESLKADKAARQKAANPEGS